MSHSIIKQAEADLLQLEKTAFVAQSAEYLKAMRGPLMLALAMGAVPAGIAFFTSKKDKERHEKDLSASREATLKKDPGFNKNLDKFTERFNELSVISPAIAKNPSLASKVVGKKLTSGFSLDDLHKLTAINVNYRPSESPSGASRTAAGAGLHTFVNILGQTALSSMVNSGSNTQATTQEVTKEQKSDNEAFVEKMLAKQSSSNHVSDACLGRMLADRHVMLKTAGLWEGVKSALKPGVEGVGKTLLYMAPALALGGGVELVRQVMESRRNSELESKANNVFLTLKKDSDKVKGDHALAQEAFDTLKAFAPSLAVRPQVVKTFVESVVDAGRMPYQQVAELAEAENKIRGVSKGDGFLGGVKSTLGTLGVSGPKSEDLRTSYPNSWFGKKPGTTAEIK